jgi:hypothetical protein
MRKLVVALLTVLAVASAAQAQERSIYPQAELDQMLAPIALYPDALLSQVLMASTYPLDIVEAARWTRAHPGLQGDEAVTLVADEGWDPSVKSLVAFPKLLQRLDENLAWTRCLGQAFLEQEPHVMETVQRLRQRAAAAGHLLPDERLRVVAHGDTIAIEQADTRVVYVPYYDPWVVYGTWGWPAYPPLVWSPWSSVAIHVTAGFFFGGIDWHHRHVKVVHARSHYLRPRHPGRAYRPIHVGKWQHAPRNRHVVRPLVKRPARFVAPSRPMPPALSASPAPARTLATPRVIERPRQVERPRQTERSRPLESPRQVERPRQAERQQPGFVRQPAARPAPPIFRAEPRERDRGRQRRAERNGHRS